jgi:hypothetical protein
MDNFSDGTGRLTEQGLLELAKHWHFYEMRQLDDGTLIGLGPLMYTTAIYIDVERWGWGKRFCFKEHDTAVQEFRKLASGDEEPVGYVARR